MESEAWVTFFWNVENYSYCWQKRGTALYSPVFKVTLPENTSWKLLLYPNGYTEEHSISYFLSVSRDNSESIEIECDLAILAEDGSVLQIKEKERILLEEECEWRTELLALRKDVTVTRKEAFLSKDTLRLRCRVWKTDVNCTLTARFFARTILKTKEWNFFWDIGRFSSLKSGKVTTCRLTDGDMLFIIILNNEGKFEIRMESINPTAIKFLKFQPFITVTNGGQKACEKCEILPYQGNVLCTLPFTKKYLMENKNLYLENDVLTLYCECSCSDGFALKGDIERIVYGIISPSINKDVRTKPYSPPTEVSHYDKMLDLKEDLKCLYAEGILSDVKLRTTTQTFHAHKAILSARSPVFRRMFSTDMREKIQECVDVPDLEDDTMHRMLQYVYTNALEDLQWESALKLYAAADKYEIVALQKKCSYFLKCNLCPNNLCDLLVLADMHGTLT